MDPSYNKAGFVKLLVIILALIIVPIIGYVIYVRYSPEAIKSRESAAQAQKATKAISDMEAALRADTYGGKTPQETLDLFTAALRKGDIDLASKYFALDTNMNSPDYLTRRKWEDGLRTAKAKDRLEQIILSMASVVATSTWDSENSAVFESLNEKGIVDVLIQMQRNQYSGVWKIESL